MLDAYFKKNNAVKVQLVVFNIDIQYQKTFQIIKSNWKKLKRELEKITYDGASSFDFLSEYTDNATTHFLFSDGLNTLSQLNFRFKKRTHVVNSIVSANHLILKSFANKSGGNYINLQQISIKKAILKLVSKPLQIVGTNLANDVEYYPKKGSLITSNFNLVAKGEIKIKKIKFFVGYGNDTIKTISINRKEKSHKNSVVSKIWAQQKINWLSVNENENRKKIIDLSKRYQIISSFTSMLILDRVEDYVTHTIKPPKELIKDYNRLLALKENNKKERLQRLQNTLFDEYENLFKWFDKKFKKIVKNKIKKKKVIKVVSTTSNNREIERDTILQSDEFLITGIVSDENGEMPGVSIVEKGTTNGAETDFEGKFTLKVTQGDVIVFSYIGYKTIEKTIASSRSINIVLEEGGAVLDEVVVTALGMRREKKSLRYTVSSVLSESISHSLSGRVAGVAITKNSGFVGSSSKIIIRGASSISSNSQPLYVVDGKIVKNLSSIEQENIHSLYVLNSEQGQQIFGSKAKNGIVVCVTKTGFDNGLDTIDDFEDLVKEKVELKGWNPKTPYLKILNKEKSTALAYVKYLQLRDTYSKSPSFYIDVADYFKNKGAEKIAIRILTNVAEIDLDNYELLKALAYKFEAYKLWEYSVYVYKEILELRPEDIQSYRDLALVYEQVGEYQKSVDLLYRIVNGELLEKEENRSFSGVEAIALTELNRVLLKYKGKINTSHIDSRFIKNTSVDIKIVIDWNHNDTDIDLWVIDPNNEKCYYGHKKTKQGGLLSDDMTEGFGPEQFLLKNAIKGNYQIKIKYYASNQQKVSGPTFLKITTFKNYGKKNEVKTSQLVRLKNVNEVLNLGNLIF